MAKAASKKIYAVTIRPGEDMKPAVYLVKAFSRAKAQGHVLDRVATCALASQDDLIALTKLGVPVEEI